MRRRPAARALRRAALAYLLRSATAQDPLAGNYGGDYGGPPPPQHMAPPGNRPQGMAPSNGGGGGGGLGGKLAFLTIGAGAVKAYDSFQAQKKERAHDKRMSSLQTSVAVKKVETEQVASQLQTCYQTVRSLQQALYESEQEALQRDYEEFKAPDSDGDERINMYEFGSYIKNYMKAYPHIPEEDYPTFEDFDANGDGTVTFKEWQAYLKAQKAEAKSTKASQKGYEGLSKKADESQSFAEMYRKLKAAGG
jgi:Ca2+-binding EF-hand superfamily protein